MADQASNLEQQARLVATLLGASANDTMALLEQNELLLCIPRVLIQIITDRQLQLRVMLQSGVAALVRRCTRES